ncbi:UDP-N-acetylglucosamine--N-acetylmuramyl-(pentapeptide) pyrophosphoryl-undecaprenol N-acetylglucosamine transferase [Candidatus Saccharibacteria bacterium]|nr:UDP-N-acetylglucosamine--N-acetylmuramyl-(pentapeptide) pyrophosphoryl-undecaprenol N-acetylglucosamine transferase [Candidatus Saccharibacteria bacterium]
MKILVVGGGSGGHVTPVVAVVREIWKVRPRAKIEFWTDKKYFKNARKITVENGMDLRIRKVVAGKLRRYTNFTFFTYLQHFDVVLKNIRDFFKNIIGFFQSFFRLIKNRPDVIFFKGGFVCLPVGMAAKILRIPYVIHDSDAAPGLTNRLLAKRATKIATGMPLEYYSYPADRAEWTGIPINDEFQPVTAAKQRSLKKELGFDNSKPLLVVTGGSLGAQNINFAVRDILPQLLKFTSVMLVAGRERYPEMMDLKEYEVWEDGELKTNFRMVKFSSEMFKLFGAADVVVSRAGASTMTELSSMAKAVIMVPNAKLPGYHQVKNAKAYEKADAVVVVEDSEIVKKPEILLEAIRKLMKSEAKREEMSKNLRAFVKDNAAENLANTIISVAKNQD